ncbi:MauE/DoxX family redox-associated membrane protein [Nonomuraea salmonea]|uniref:MauE/DoxX family redox-associated membrane protein n=1 Tax=Nonomuraea salmonea TaxID=46181 RepID=UPI0031E7B4EC
MLESQLPLLIVMLALGTVAKVGTVTSGGEPGSLSRLGPAVLVPGRMQAPALLVCAAAELALATGLLVTTHPLFRWGTVAFFALSTYVLLELRRRRPDAGCGCFGEVSSAPVGLRSIGRTVVLTGMAVLSVWAPVPGWVSVFHLSWYAAAGVALLVLLSPEVEELIDRVRFRAPPASSAAARQSRSPCRGSGRVASGGRAGRSWCRRSRTTAGGSCAGASSPSATTTATTWSSRSTSAGGARRCGWPWSARRTASLSRNIRQYRPDARQR